MLPCFAGLASGDLKEAETWTLQACKQGSNIRSSWKLLGDIRTAYLHVSPENTHHSLGAKESNTFESFIEL